MRRNSSGSRSFLALRRRAPRIRAACLRAGRCRIGGSGRFGRGRAVRSGTRRLGFGLLTLRRRAPRIRAACLRAGRCRIGGSGQRAAGSGQRAVWARSRCALRDPAHGFWFLDPQTAGAAHPRGLPSRRALSHRRRRAVWARSRCALRDRVHAVWLLASACSASASVSAWWGAAPGSRPPRQGPGCTHRHSGPHRSEIDARSGTSPCSSRPKPPPTPPR